MRGRFVIKNRRTTLERVEKFVSPTYFSDCNLSGRLYVKSCALQSLKSFSSPNIITYDEACNREFRDVQPGQQFGPTWSTHWFKLEVQIPHEWIGSEVRLVWDSESEGLLWRDGVPIQGFTSEQRRIYYVLSKKLDLLQETRFTLYVEMTCNSIFGAGDGDFIRPPKPDKYFTLNRAEIVVFDGMVQDLLLDFEVLIDMIKELPEESHRGYEALYVANEMVNLASDGNKESYLEAHKLAEKFFNEKNGDAQFDLFAVGHCHIDTAWLWPYKETRRKCARSFSSVIQLMEKFPTFRFACSQAQQYDWVKQYYPELYEQLRVKVRESKFLPVGGTWVEMDCNIPSGESLVRQFLMGQKFFIKEFNIKCSEFWLPDTFGYPGQLPQIMKLFGINRFVTQKMSWSLVNKFPHHTFWWHGIDDSRVLAHFPPGDSYNMNCNPSELLKSSKNFQDKGRSNCSLFLYGFGDGGQGPTEDMLYKLERMKDVDGLPRILHSNVDDFFSRVEEQSSNGLLCSWKGELFLELHNATYTTHALVKKSNRLCEILLRNVELVEALSSVVKQKMKNENRQEEIERLWKLLLLNQFHDVLPGTSINEVYNDSHQHYNDIMKSGSELLGSSLYDLTENEKVEVNNVVVFNSMSWNRRECIELSDDSFGLGVQREMMQKLRNGNFLVLVSIPSVGYNFINSEYKISPCEFCSVQEIEDERFYVQNGLVSAVINSSGHVTELYAIGNEKNAIARGHHGNQLLLFDDVPLYWDAWDVMDYHLETLQPQNDVISKVEVIEKGPIRVVLEVSYKIGRKSSLKQTIILDACCSYIQFHTKVDWAESHKFLKVEFPLSVLCRHVTYEIQFGHLERPTHFNTSWDSAKFEVCGHKWADCSEFGFGVAVLNDSKYGWSCIDNKLRLSLLRSSKSPDDNADIGEHQFAYAIMPHTGSFQESGVIQSSYNFNNPLLIGRMHRALSSKSFISISSKSVILEAFKLSESSANKCIARFYEAFGGSSSASVNFTFKVNYIRICDLMENELNEVPTMKEMGKTMVELSFKPFEIKTLSITFA